MTRDAVFLLHYLNTVESIGFIICSMVFAISIYHIYFQRNIASLQSVSSSTSISSPKTRKIAGRIDSKIKYLALLSIFMYALSCVTNIFSKEATEWMHIWFVSTQLSWAFATIISHFLFIRQLYIIYNQSNSIYAISKSTYNILYVLIGIFAVFMFTKSILIVLLDNDYISSNQYGHIGAASVYISSVTDIFISICVLYLLHSRLSITIRQLQQPDTINDKLEHNFINVRLKHSVLTLFALFTSQLYLIIWSVTVLMWYNYNGANKTQYIYDFTIATLTLRTVACVTNALVIMLNFKFSTKYYHICCHLCLLCYWKMRIHSRSDCSVTKDHQKAHELRCINSKTATEYNCENDVSADDTNTDNSTNSNDETTHKLV